MGTKVEALSLVGVCGGLITTLFGGWSTALTTLVIFMAIDYITGIMVAGVFQASQKSCNGGLNSRIGLKGICKKGVSLLVVIVAVRLDILAGTTFLRDASIIALVANEAISIVENAGLMGLPIPTQLRKAIDVLNDKDKGVE